jgi:hypothetical protein
MVNSIALLGSVLLSHVAAQSNPRIASLEGFTNVSDPYYGQSPPVYPTRKPPGRLPGRQELTVIQLRVTAVSTQHGRMPTLELAT